MSEDAVKAFALMRVLGVGSQRGSEEQFDAAEHTLGLPVLSVHPPESATLRLLAEASGG